MVRLGKESDTKHEGEKGVKPQLERNLRDIPIFLMAMDRCHGQKKKHVPNCPSLQYHSFKFGTKDVSTMILLRYWGLQNTGISINSRILQLQNM